MTSAAMPDATAILGNDTLLNQTIAAAIAEALAEGATAEYSSFGGWAICQLFCLMLYGAFVVQSLLLMTEAGEKRPKPLAIFVSVITVLEALAAVGIMYGLIHDWIANFGKIDVSLYIPWSVPTFALAGAVIALVVEWFYIHRIWLLSGRRVWAVIIPAVTSLVAFGAALPAAYYLIAPKTWLAAGADRGSKISIGIFLTSAAITDVAIAATMVTLLEKERTRSNIRSTSGLLRWLSAISLGTGCLTAVLFLAAVIDFWIVSGRNVLWAGFFCIATFLYGNSVMFIIRSKGQLREQWRGKVINMAEEMQMDRRRSPGSSGATRSQDDQDQGVHVLKEVRTDMSSDQGTFAM